MSRRQPTVGFSLAAAILVCTLAASSLAWGAQPATLTGSIQGAVKNAAGVAQMGAAVILYNRYDRLLRQAVTDSNGRFNFEGLIPDLYSVRVSLTSFVPAFRRNIAVQPGAQSLLTINLTGILSSVELASARPAKGSLMAEDWKWVLRSAQATRPVLRFLDLDEDRLKPRFTSVFSETRGIVKLSAGDGNPFFGNAAQPDLGTAFALATSLFGSNQLQVSGNVGYATHTGLPAAGFRTTYSRTGARVTPQVTVTMRQVSLPVRKGFGYGAGDGPALRTMSMTTLDEIWVLDNVRIEYGLSLESISLLNRLNTLSPFGRLTYEMDSLGSIQVAYSSGATPVELASRIPGASPHSGEGAQNQNAELQRDLTALGALPMVSIRGGKAAVQRTGNVEIGYRKVAGSRTYGAGIYRERVTNGALTMAGGPDDLFAGDLLPDLASRSSIFNIGNFSRWGYLASINQSLGEKLEVGLAYGRGGALTATGNPIATNNAAQLRDAVKIAEKNWATARVAGTAPLAGTRFAASYGWADYKSLMPTHYYLTQSTRPEPGFNVSIRQPIPAFGLVPGRFEASAELRNLLEQGYLPFKSADGTKLLLTNAPRAVRGGLAFIF